MNLLTWERSFISHFLNGQRKNEKAIEKNQAQSGDLPQLHRILLLKLHTFHRMITYTLPFARCWVKTQSGRNEGWEEEEIKMTPYPQIIRKRQRKMYQLWNDSKYLIMRQLPIKPFSTKLPTLDCQYGSQGLHT